MLKAGTDYGATGENAVIVGVRNLGIKEMIEEVLTELRKLAE